MECTTALSYFCTLCLLVILYLLPPSLIMTHVAGHYGLPRRICYHFCRRTYCYHSRSYMIPHEAVIVRTNSRCNIVYRPPPFSYYNHRRSSLVYRRPPFQYYTTRRKMLPPPPLYQCPLAPNQWMTPFGQLSSDFIF